MAEPRWITAELVDELRERAAESPRRRINHNFHAGAGDNPQRFLNVMLRGTYCRPHRHVTPPKAESWIVLEGAVRFFVFDDAGVITGVRDVGAGSATMGIDLPEGEWHTLCVTTESAVIFEVKPGPWDAATDKEFAAWAPAEGEPGVEEYLAALLGHGE